MVDGLHTNARGNNWWWYKNGKLHREDGPAVGSGRYKAWFKDGSLHREDGPAIEFADGVNGWHLNGEWLGLGTEGFWKLWDRLTPEQRGNPTLLRYLPRCTS